MKKLIRTGSVLTLSMAASTTFAHPGHGLGLIGHDLQHQLWIFGALVVTGAVCMLAQDHNREKK